MVFFKFSDIITLSSDILSVVYSVLMSVCCLITKMVPGFLNLTLIRLIRLDRVRSSSPLYIFRICVATGHLPASSRASVILLRYSMPRASA